MKNTEGTRDSQEDMISNEILVISNYALKSVCTRAEGVERIASLSAIFLTQSSKYKRCLFSSLIIFPSFSTYVCFVSTTLLRCILNCGVVPTYLSAWDLFIAKSEEYLWNSRNLHDASQQPLQPYPAYEIIYFSKLQAVLGHVVDVDEERARRLSRSAYTFSCIPIYIFSFTSSFRLSLIRRMQIYT